MEGEKILTDAEWLLGFDFDGTLADIQDGYSVSQEFFQTLRTLKEDSKIAWGICTGRSLEFLMEGMLHARFPFLPDYVVAQERDIFFLSEEGTYQPDTERNNRAHSDLNKTLSKNTPTLKKVQTYIEKHTNGEWINIPEDPAGIIATSVEEIQEAVNIFHRCNERSTELDYQRNSIYLRFTHKEFCKGTAIQHLQAQFNLTKEKTIVMGDNYNDLTMLNSTVASHYGGPSNSIKELKEALKETTGYIEKRRCSLAVTDAINRIIGQQS